MGSREPGRSRKRKPSSGRAAKFVAALFLAGAICMLGAAVYLYIGGELPKAQPGSFTELIADIKDMGQKLITGSDESGRKAEVDDGASGSTAAWTDGTFLNADASDKAGDGTESNAEASVISGSGYDDNGDALNNGDAHSSASSNTSGSTSGSTSNSNNSDSETGSAAANEEAARLTRLAALTADGSFKAIEQTDPDTVSILFAGDILFDSHYAIMVSMLQRSGGKSAAVPDISAAFDDTLLDSMRSADIFMLNNEFPYSDRGTPLKNKAFTFRAAPSYVSLLNDMGTDIAGLANNHINDYGLDAMTDTFSVLRDAGIDYVGAGEDIEEASKTLYYTNGDLKLAFIATTQIERMPGPDTVGATENSAGVFRCYSDNELERLLSRVHEADEAGCFTIVFIHWGTESTENIDSWQLKQGQAIADAGADIIIGDHPHVLQRLDYIGSERNVPVIYSLGNYLFNSKALDTCLYSVKLDAHDGSIAELKFIPAVQKNCRTSIAEGSEKERILKHMRDISPDVSIDEEGVISSR